MSFECGIGPLAAKTLGVKARQPRIVCDGCGARQPVLAPRAKATPGWFHHGKAVPGWSGGMIDDDTRRREDYCPACTQTRKETP